MWLLDRSRASHLIYSGALRQVKILATLSQCDNSHYTVLGYIPLVASTRCFARSLLRSKILIYFLVRFKITSTLICWGVVLSGAGYNICTVCTHSIFPPMHHLPVLMHCYCRSTFCCMHLSIFVVHFKTLFIVVSPLSAVCSLYYTSFAKGGKKQGTKKVRHLIASM